MENELKHYYRVKYALVCARQSFLKEPVKDDFEEYAKKIIDRAYFIILNKIGELAHQAQGVRIFAEGEIPGAREEQAPPLPLTPRPFYAILKPTTRKAVVQCKKTT